MQFTQYWFNDQRSLHTQLLEHRKQRSLHTQLLEHCKHDELHILEIGAFEGMSTVFFMDYLEHPNSTLSTIDPFLTTDTTTPVTQHTYERFLNNIGQAKNRSKLTVYKDSSHHILPTLSRMFDYIVVDGSHETKDVLNDAIHAMELVKTNGTIFFDDYGSPTVQRALNTLIPNPKFKVLHKGWHLVVQRK